METLKYDISKTNQDRNVLSKVFCNRMTWSTILFSWKKSVKLIVKGENRFFVNFSCKNWSKNAFFERFWADYTYTAAYRKKTIGTSNFIPILSYRKYPQEQNWADVFFLLNKFEQR